MPYVDTTVDAARLEARATRKRRGAWVILGGVLVGFFYQVFAVAAAFAFGDLGF
jgi:hypothetical protein